MIIISHQIYLQTGAQETAIAITICKPERRDKAWACRYAINWPDGQRIFEAIGFDQLQALVLALQMIGAEIYTSTYHQEGRLRAYDHDKGYGFPVASSLRELLVGVDRIGM